jgi:hypothetical protein
MYPTVPTTTPGGRFGDVSPDQHRFGTSRGRFRQLRQAEVENLESTVARHEDVFRLEIAVDDALLVSRGQAPAHLNRILDRFLHGQRPGLDGVAQRLPFQQLGHDVRLTVVRGDFVDREDVRMIQSSRCTRFLLETPQPIRICAVRHRQDFDRDLATELRIARAIHLAHAARAECGDDLVRAEASTGTKEHKPGWLSRAPLILAGRRKQRPLGFSGKVAVSDSRFDDSRFDDSRFDDSDSTIRGFDDSRIRRFVDSRMRDSGLVIRD